MGEGLLHLWMSGGIMGCGWATPNEATGMLLAAQVCNSCLGTQISG